MKFSIPGLRG